MARTLPNTGRGGSTRAMEGHYMLVQISTITVYLLVLKRVR